MKSPPLRRDATPIFVSLPTFRPQRNAMCLAIAAVVLGSSSAFCQIRGITYDGDVYAIDSETGTGVLLGPSGFGGTNSMAEHQGTLYSAPLGVPPRPLISIDPTTGAGSPLVDFDRALDVRGMAISTDGSMYVINHIDFQNLFDDELWCVDSKTGATTLVGSMGRPSFQGLAFDEAGTLYAWSISQGLHTVNLESGLAVDVNPNFGFGDADIQTLDFAPNGKLYGGRDALYTIDPTTGVPFLIGAGGYADLRGIAYVPEPAALCLCVAACMSLMLSRLQRVDRRAPVATDEVAHQPTRHGL